LHFS
jgi:hypothetical protein